MKLIILAETLLRSVVQWLHLEHSMFGDAGIFGANEVTFWFPIYTVLGHGGSAIENF
uniref:Uncharacterized protein n=1 Tax=Arundo donax TaxID=35708 RepID=A0A0A9D3L5_ARUDO